MSAFLKRGLCSNLSSLPKRRNPGSSSTEEKHTEEAGVGNTHRDAQNQGAQCPALLSSLNEGMYNQQPGTG